jgi:hypothetical protein
MVIIFCDHYPISMQKELRTARLSASAGAARLNPLLSFRSQVPFNHVDSWQIRGDGRWPRSDSMVRFMHKVGYRGAANPALLPFVIGAKTARCPADPTSTASPIIQASFKSRRRRISRAFDSSHTHTPDAEGLWFEHDLFFTVLALTVCSSEATVARSAVSVMHVCLHSLPIDIFERVATKNKGAVPL